MNKLLHNVAAIDRVSVPSPIAIDILMDTVSRGFAVERFRCLGHFAVNLDDSR